MATVPGCWTCMRLICRRNVESGTVEQWRSGEMVFPLLHCSVASLLRFHLFTRKKISVKENQQNNINDSYKDSVLVSELFLVISKHTFIYFF